MRGKDSFIILLALFGMGLSFAAASLVMQPINETRKDLQLNADHEALAALPPQVAFTYAMLGSFRGLAVDVLWGRATKLKEEGKFHEAMQLSSWICTLQPRFAQVWAFHAWNMAYNISVATHTEEERWMWVRAGIELLRDRGIPLNPTSTQLYKELSWIFLHKVGQFSDDMHFFYKRELAEEWHEILGPPPTTSTQDVVEWFKPVHEAHELISQAQSPELTAQLDAFTAEYPKVTPLVSQLRDMGFELNVDLLRTVGKLLARAEAYRAGIWPVQRPVADNEAEQQLLEWIFKSDDPEARDQLLAFLRARVLVHHYHMDPAFIMELMQGEWLIVEESDFTRSIELPNPTEPKQLPLDFRHPATHGLYWASLGVKVSEGVRNIDDSNRFQVLNTDRQVLHALQALTHNGRITYDPITGYYTQLPDARYITAYERAVVTAGQRIGGKYLTTTAPSSFRSGHENFLIWSMQLTYRYGSEQQARNIYGRLRRTYSNFQEGRAERYSQPMAEFIRAQDKENLTSLDNASLYVTGNLTQALIQGYANGNAEIAQRWNALAEEAYHWYQKKQNRETYNTSVRNRMGLPPLAEMKADALYQLLTQSPQVAHPLLKARIWRNIPDGAKRRVFDRVRTPLYRQAMQIGLDPERVFPEPPGMEAYRQANPRTEVGPTAPGAERNPASTIQ